MKDLSDLLREVGRTFEALAQALELEEGRTPRDPRRAERLEAARRSMVARAVAEPGFRRRLFTDPERVFGRPDHSFERLAHRLRELDEALGQVDDEVGFDDRELV
jgi:hypothetical protein